MARFLIETEEKCIVHYKYYIEANTQYEAIKQFIENPSRTSYDDYEITDDLETISIDCTLKG